MPNPAFTRILLKGERKLANIKAGTIVKDTHMDLP
ncbi:MAG: hypothetical protein K0Q87_3851, partial [Neobacillus sp.]|nr:hypothetical protein [Neobacillus sp.]